jgi:hypothetical protein
MRPLVAEHDPKKWERFVRDNAKRSRARIVLNQQAKMP